MTIDRYAVLGHPISHSKSPRIHRLFAEQTAQQLEYTAIDVSPEQFNQAVARFFNNGGKGLNCTVPLKELAWQCADVLTERATFAKAVNTLALQADGSLLGDNTDGVGLVNDLIHNQIRLKNQRILILGAGGASRGIIAPLVKQQPAHIVIANRTLSRARELVADFKIIATLSGCRFEDLAGQSFDLILNATSASLSDQLPPLPADVLKVGGCCYDLVYGNKPTAFVRWGLEHHAAKSLDGLGMLVEQAAEAFYVWRGIKPKTAEVITLLNSERQQSVVPD